MAIHAHGPRPKGLLCNAGAGAGAAAGVIAATFVCPLDVSKTRFQVHGLPQLSNANVKRLSYSWKFGTHVSKGGLSWYVPWTLPRCLHCSDVGRCTSQFMSNHKVFLVLLVVRSRLQEQGHHSEVFKQDGIPGFCRGCATNLLRTLQQL